MAQQRDSFRDFGILPQGLTAPADCVRASFSRGRIIGQFIGTGLVSAMGLGLATALALAVPFPLNLLGVVAALAGFGTFVFLATHNDYRWIELDHNTLRAKHLYTGQLIERRVDEIECLATMAYQLRHDSTDFIEAVLGRVKGIEVRFRDRRTPLRILRADPAMVQARELIEAIIYRMTQVGEVEAEIIQFVEQPMVRYVHWKGERPAVQSGKGLKVTLCCLIFIALMFGSITGFLGRVEQKKLKLASVPPQEIALAALIEHGPGANPHVVLTDFRFGGYLVETKNGVMDQVWIALLPTGQPIPGEQGVQAREIKAVLTCRSIHGNGALALFLRQGHVKGLCSNAPGFRYGTIRADLIKENPGFDLVAAWNIEEMNEPPTEAEVNGILLTSGGCFAVILALVMVVYLKST